MFGRSRRKNKIIVEVLKEARLESYAKQFDKHMDKLKLSHQKYVKMAIEGKENNDEHMMMTGVKYAKYVENNIGKMRILKTNLDVAKINLDNQEAYQKFLVSVSDFTSELKDKKISGWFIGKVLKKYRKETNALSNQMDLVDRKLNKIDKSMEEIYSESGRFEKVDVDAFFAKLDKK